MADVKTNNAETSIDNIKQHGFYYADDVRPDNVRPELFDLVACELGRAFAQTNRVSSAQLRGFFGDVKALEVKLQEMSRQPSQKSAKEGDISDAVFRENEYLVRMIIPKIAYIQGKRTGGRVSLEFRQFIEASIDKVRSARDFSIFMRLFESVVGFFYGFGGGRNA